MTNEVKKAVINLLKEVCGNVYSGHSAVIYPKININLKQVENSPHRNRYMLILDFYTKNEGAEGAELLAERTEAAIARTKAVLPDGGYMSIYKADSGGFVEYRESDKISQYLDNYEIIYYKNKEE